MKDLQEAGVGLLCMFICALPIVVGAALAAVLGLDVLGAIALGFIVLCVIRLNSGKV